MALLVFPVIPIELQLEVLAYLPADGRPHPARAVCRAWRAAANAAAVPPEWFLPVLLGSADVAEADRGAWLDFVFGRTGAGRDRPGPEPHSVHAHHMVVHPALGNPQVRRPTIADMWDSQGWVDAPPPKWPSHWLEWLVHTREPAPRVNGVYPLSGAPRSAALHRWVTHHEYATNTRWAAQKALRRARGAAAAAATAQRLLERAMSYICRHQLFELARPYAQIAMAKGWPTLLRRWFSVVCAMRGTSPLARLSAARGILSEFSHAIDAKTYALAVRGACYRNDAELVTYLIEERPGTLTPALQGVVYMQVKISGRCEGVAAYLERRFSLTPPSPRAVRACRHGQQRCAYRGRYARPGQRRER